MFNVEFTAGALQDLRELRTFDQRQIMAAVDDFDHEIARTRQNARLMSLLEERASQQERVPLEEVKRELGLT